jgi:hypothetical protein
VAHLGSDLRARIFGGVAQNLALSLVALRAGYAGDLRDNLAQTKQQRTQGLPHSGCSATVEETRMLAVLSNVELTGRRRVGALAARCMMNQGRLAAKVTSRWRSG